MGCFEIFRCLEALHLGSGNAELFKHTYVCHCSSLCNIHVRAQVFRDGETKIKLFYMQLYIEMHVYLQIKTCSCTLIAIILQ